MLTLLGALFLGLLTLVGISLQKTYKNLPRRELKRRAAKGDELAKLLYRAVAYGMSLEILLWIVIGLGAAGFFVLVADSLPTWLALFGSVALVWLGFAYMPNSRVTNAGNTIARVATPPIAWLLSHIYPILNRFGNFLQTHGRIQIHTGIFQKDDLLSLIDKQSEQADNRIDKAELAIAKHALTFGDKVIRDVMIPLRVVKTVKATDTVGPVLMAELHKSGFSRFPVIGDKKGEIAGTLYLRDLVAAKTGGSVSSLMNKKVYYVNEEKPLQHVLDAFLKTKHHLFMVVNEFEEISGIITIEDILEQVLGKQIVDEFDKYDDMRAVAALQAKKDRKNHNHPAGEHSEASAEKPSEEATPVDKKE